jgi:hypothetical protein
MNPRQHLNQKKTPAQVTQKPEQETTTMNTKLN